MLLKVRTRSPTARTSSTSWSDRRRSSSFRIGCEVERDAMRLCITHRIALHRACWLASPSLACTLTAFAVRSIRRRARPCCSSAVCAGRSAMTRRCVLHSLEPASISRSAPSNWRSTNNVVLLEVFAFDLLLLLLRRLFKF